MQPRRGSLHGHQLCPQLRLAPLQLLQPALERARRRTSHDGVHRPLDLPLKPRQLLPPAHQPGGRLRLQPVPSCGDLTLRESRRIKTALVMARNSTIKTLAGFDFGFQPSLDRNRIMALAGVDFVDRHEVVHFTGPPGCGKTHLSIALGIEAVRAGRSVHFIGLADLVGTLARAEREGSLRGKIRFFSRFALLIVDEIGYLPVVPGGGNLFFQLVNARYERGAMILTSNHGFAEWGQIFGDPVVATALLDRLLDGAVVVQIEGAPSVRSKSGEAMR